MVRLFDCWLGDKIGETFEQLSNRIIDAHG